MLSSFLTDLTEACARVTMNRFKDSSTRDWCHAPSRQRPKRSELDPPGRPSLNRFARQRERDMREGCNV